jgi:hypothetical protein
MMKGSERRKETIAILGISERMARQPPRKGESVTSRADRQPRKNNFIIQLRILPFPAIAPSIFISNM